MHMGSLNFLLSPKRCGLPEWHGQEFDIEDERIPAPVRALVAKDYRLGYALYFHDTAKGGEWWLLDGCDLIETYWLK